jgi:hypothetical protein
VTGLIMARFDKFNAEQNGGSEPEEPVPSVEAPTNGHAAKRTPDGDSALSELDDSPPKKKQKKHRERRCCVCRQAAGRGEHGVTREVDQGRYYQEEGPRAEEKEGEEEEEREQGQGRGR